MKKYRLKKWVLPTIYVMSISIIIISVVFISDSIINNYDGSEDIRYVSEEIVPESVTEVVEVTNETVNHPYLLESVKVAKDFYDKSATEESKINSLLFYKDTYMQNTGVLYSADENFDVVSVLDGTITSITEDEILGTVVEVTHSTDLITVYQCLSEATLKVGDEVKQNDVIGTSGKVNIDTGYEHSLLFEVNYKGSILNPNEFYNMKVSDLLS